MASEHCTEPERKDDGNGKEKHRLGRTRIQLYSDRLALCGELCEWRVGRGRADCGGRRGNQRMRRRSAIFPVLF